MIYTFPSTIIPARTDWQLQSNTQSFTSPLTKTAQTKELPGARWVASMSFSDRNQDNSRDLMAFLVKLRGQAGRFYLYDHGLPTPRGAATGSPLVKGSGQTGTTLAIDGWSGSVTNILKAGDYLEVNGELKIVTEDINSVAGEATVTFEPPLRAAPSDNAVVTITKAPAIMRLQDDDQAKWGTRGPSLSSFSITAIESFT